MSNGIEVYSTHIEGKSVVAEKFIKTLNNKVYKYTYHSTIEMRPAEVKWRRTLALIKKLIRKILNLKLVIM